MKTCFYLTLILGIHIAETRHKLDTRIIKSSRNVFDEWLGFANTFIKNLDGFLGLIWNFINLLCANCLPPTLFIPELPISPQSRPGPSTVPPLLATIPGIPQIIGIIIDAIASFLPTITNLLGAIIPMPGVGLLISNIINFVINTVPSILGTLLNFLNRIFSLDLPAIKTIGDVASIIIIIFGGIITNVLQAGITFFNRFVGPTIGIDISTNPNATLLELLGNILTTLIIKALQTLVRFANPLLNGTLNFTLPVPEDDQRDLVVLVNSLASPLTETFIQILFNFFNSTIGALIKVTFPTLPKGLQNPILVILEGLNVAITTILKTSSVLFNNSLGKLIVLQLPDDKNNIDYPMGIMHEVLHLLLNKIFGGITQFLNNIVYALFGVRKLISTPGEILDNIAKACSRLLGSILKSIVIFINDFTGITGITIPDCGNTKDCFEELFKITGVVAHRVWNYITGLNTIITTVIQIQQLKTRLLTAAETTRPKFIKSRTPKSSRTSFQGLQEQRRQK